MKRKREKEDSGLPKVSDRKKPHITILHKLKHSGAEIKISAKPEDWLKFREHYVLSLDKLWSDFLPIMEVAHLHSTPKTRHKKRQVKINALKVFAAILCKYLERIDQTKQFPKSLKRIYQFFRQEKNFNIDNMAACFIDYVFRDYFDKWIFGNPYEDESAFYRIELKPFFRGSDEMPETFLKTYVYKGLKLIKDNNEETLRHLLREVEDILRSMRILSNVSSVKYQKEIHSFLFDVSQATCTQFIDPEDMTIKTYRDDNGTLKPIIEESRLKEIQSIRSVLKEILPKLPLPIPD